MPKTAQTVRETETVKESMLKKEKKREKSHTFLIMKKSRSTYKAGLEHRGCYSGKEKHSVLLKD